MYTCTNSYKINNLKLNFDINPLSLPVKPRSWSYKLQATYILSAFTSRLSSILDWTTYLFYPVLPNRVRLSVVPSHLTCLYQRPHSSRFSKVEACTRFTGQAELDSNTRLAGRVGLVGDISDYWIFWILRLLFHGNKEARERTLPFFYRSRFCFRCYLDPSNLFLPPRTCFVEDSLLYSFLDLSVYLSTGYLSLYLILINYLPRHSK